MRKLIDSLNASIGHWGIPALLRFIAICQVATWALSKFEPGMINWLACEPALILQGQVWRVFSWVVISPPDTHPIFVLFGCLFTWRMSDALDEGWGPFRVNLYVLACCLSCTAAAFIWGLGVMNLMLFGSAILFAYATLYPNEELMLFPLPITFAVKWLALVIAGLLAVQFLSAPLVMWPMWIAMLPYLAVFAPDFVLGSAHQLGVIQRRQRLQSAQPPAGEALHTCSRCGKTDSEHPELEFRVNAEGDDVCAECRKG